MKFKIGDYVIFDRKSQINNKFHFPQEVSFDKAYKITRVLDLKLVLLEGFMLNRAFNMIRFKPLNTKDLTNLEKVIYGIEID